jgi:FixJ family two-component response regulator
MIRSLLEHLVKTTSGKLLLGCRRTADFARIEFWRSKRLPQRRVPDEDAAQGAAGSEIAKKLADLLGCRLRISLDPRRPVFTLEIPLGAPQDATMPDAEAASAMRDRPIEPGAAADAATVFIVDDDDDVLTSVQHILQRPGLSIATYTSAEAFLASFVPNNHSCLLVDAHLAGMQGIELIRQLNAMGHRPPTIVISGRADIAVAVEAMKAGAVDFVEKPLNSSSLRVAVERALTQARHQHETTTERQEILGNLAKLSTRQRQVLHLMLEGKSSKTIAAQLFMSQRTVESHRANVMKKMNTKSLPELARKVSVVRSDASSGAHPAPDFDPLLSKP